MQTGSDGEIIRKAHEPTWSGNDPGIEGPPNERFLKGYHPTGAAGLRFKHHERTGNNYLLKSVKEQALRGELKEEQSRW